MQGYPSPSTSPSSRSPRADSTVSRSNPRRCRSVQALCGGKPRMRRAARFASGSRLAIPASTSDRGSPSPSSRASIPASPHPLSASATARPRASWASSTNPASESVATASSSASGRIPRLRSRSRSLCSDSGRVRRERTAVPRARSRRSSRARERARGRSSGRSACSPQRTTTASGTVRHGRPSSSTSTPPGAARRRLVILGGCDLVRGLLGRLGLRVRLRRRAGVVAHRQKP